MRDWTNPPNVTVPAELREAVGGHPLVARLLAQRGLSDPRSALAFLEPEHYQPAPVEALPGLVEAVDLIRRTIKDGNKIRVWGDFDADGQTSTAVLYQALKMAEALVDYDLPSRHEGHGLNQRAITEAIADGIILLITCDTGISDDALVAQAVAAGLLMIITDHHDLPEILPSAHSIINPKMLPALHPLHELSGVGVAYCVARGMLEGTSAAPSISALMDLVAIGLVADVAYQIDDVRYLVQKGLCVLRATTRPGLRALITLAQLDPTHLTEDDIGFQLAPRLNAAGRLSDAALAVRLLLTTDADEGSQLAEQLEALNRDRQARTDATKSAAEQRLQQEPELARQPVLVVDGENWEAGVLGLVASSLVQRYQRPAIVISHTAGQNSVGSARSVPGVDIHQAIASQRTYLAGEGGHPMAAGFSLPRENLLPFRHGLIDWLQRQPTPPVEVETLTPDAAVPWQEVTLSLANELRRLSPFGSGNPKPILATANGILLRIEDVSRRTTTAHRRIICNDASGHQLRFIWFNAVDEQLPEPGEQIDLAFHIDIGYWKRKADLRLELVSWRSAFKESVVASERLVTGREVIDWRQEVEVEPLLSRLQAEYGTGLVVWAEGVEPKPAGALSSVELVAIQAYALAILTAPTSPALLLRVVEQLNPQVLILLPPLTVVELSPQAFVARVLGMVRASLSDVRRNGGLDLERMAARIGARAEAVIAALRGLEASGAFSLQEEDGQLRAVGCDQSQQTGTENQPEDVSDGDADQQQALEQARQALLYQLRETRAYRAAYREVDVRALLADEPTPRRRV
ncbi:MAG: single-stranded-DNA-specific exonuclease RecJ [Anaerolineae bacterium]